MFEKINIVESKIIAAPVENIDTDQIIPARFLKKTTRDGFGKDMFRDWRYDNQGNIISTSPFAQWDKEGVTNKPTILVAGKNFGCGSSREHAAWAIADYGFKVVVSSFFADIFYNNAQNNGLLPVKVSEDFLLKIFNAFKNNPNVKLKVNLPLNTIQILDNSMAIEEFILSPYKKEVLLNGYEDIDYLITTKDLIEEYERKNF